MRLSTVLASYLAAVPTVVTAHGDIPGAPRIMLSTQSVTDLRAKVASIAKRTIHKEQALDSRGFKSRRDDRCGPGVGSCAAGLCCSGEGWCGVGEEYCPAPDCQFQYGSGCDANATPLGETTSNVPRPRLGGVAYGGEGIYRCVKPGTVAITFDDGPYIYTSGILDTLKAMNAKATFFITGNNLGKGQIDNVANPWVNVIKRMHAEGHQIASHTWSHQDLSLITPQQRKDQIYKNEMALHNILGFFPTYMRPPYSSCTAESGCQADLADLGYHVTYFDLDTEDYLNTAPTQIQTAKNNFIGNLSRNANGQGDWLAIAHDIHQQTAQNLTEYMFTVTARQGYKAVTVGECLNDPVENWYRSSSGGAFTSTNAGKPPASSTASPPGSSPGGVAPAPTAISFEGTCGGNTGTTCLGSAFGNCCSVNGWCGSTPAYCSAGCQSRFGSCSDGQSAPGAQPTSPSGSKVSLDGSCAGTTGQTCQGSTFGNCCSHAGWCGQTDDYCKSGCQLDFGTCA